MNAVDTNVLIYVHDDRDPAKKFAARELVDRLQNGVLLWQVACEYLAATRKLAPQGYTFADAKQDIDDFRQFWRTALPTWTVFDQSADLMTRHGLSSWDSLVVAACLEAGVQTLYTEDFGAPRSIDGLDIINPFLAGA